MALSTNTLAFIGLCNEYCAALQNVPAYSREEFVDSLTRLLPRIYISATDLKPEEPLDEDEDTYLQSYLEEDYYEAVRRDIETLLNPDDIYLEVFEEEMKYSDTPVSASIAENLCDIFQVAYNFTQMVKDAPEELLAMAVRAIKEDFDDYWSQKLVNVMRPLNQLRYSRTDE